MLGKIGRLPSIPEYYKEMINRNVDLLSEPKQCCPFHKEDTPSFSFNAEKGVWRCFGGCKFGGDVISLHQKNYSLRTREEAEKSLNAICGIVKRVELRAERTEVFISPERIESETLYQKALVMANTPERWLELDYFMSQVPIEALGLRDLLDKWSGRKDGDDGEEIETCE